ncbi:MAG: exodeoxyribonuclease VII small subunit [Lachnospiraceae bacterium]|nr:exodeoxyribonuclease VII small subunit [Lachnospiraceae bacterium]MDD6504735.1 exodeoxyribonuclease VII small subunit [Lachnospiraceae bacterium]
MADKKETTLEQRFETIETILQRMEEGEVSLDESFDLYKTGLAEIKAANEMLGDMEKVLMVLNENGDLEEL